MGLKWQFEMSGAAEIARFKACGISLVVCDCDGDYATLQVKQGDILIARSIVETTSATAWPFDVAMLKAERCLRNEVELRKRDLILSRFG